MFAPLFPGFYKSLEPCDVTCNKTYNLECDTMGMWHQTDDNIYNIEPSCKLRPIKDDGVGTNGDDENDGPRKQGERTAECRRALP